MVFVLLSWSGLSSIGVVIDFKHLSVCGLIEGVVVLFRKSFYPKRQISIL